MRRQCRVGPCASPAASVEPLLAALHGGHYWRRGEPRVQQGLECRARIRQRVGGQPRAVGRRPAATCETHAGAGSGTEMLPCPRGSRCQQGRRSPS
jgi:hypothetical protein